jgi:hypothetical protein
LNKNRRNSSHTLLALTLIFAAAFEASCRVSADVKPYSSLAGVLRTCTHPLQKTGHPVPQASDSLIIGDDTPNETVNITGKYTFHGDLLIINQGMLNIADADFTIDGDIIIGGNGRLNVTGGSFTVVQDYIYEHQMLLLENSSMRFSDAVFRSSGRSWSVSQFGRSRYEMHGSEVADGFITAALLDEAQAAISNSKTPGEFLCFGNNDLTFGNCDFMLFWIVLPETSVVDTALPGDLSASAWSFPDSMPDVHGIPYRVSIENCTNVMWGLISTTGSAATFRQSDFRAAGLMFTSGDSLEITGITNQSVHEDEVVGLPDRKLRLIGSNVETWNFYVSSYSNITVNNCILGEILTQEHGKATLSNSICDGSGGYLGAFDQSFMMIYGSFIRSPVIARNSSLLIGANSSFSGSEIVADEYAVMLIANTLRIAEPDALSAGVMFEIQIPPVFGETGSMVPVYGTMRLKAGPDNPVRLTGYRIDYSADPAGGNWQPTDGMHRDPVENGRLAMWNTDGLAPGDYGLRITFWHSYGDSVTIDSPARLDMPAWIEKSGQAEGRQFSLGRNYPNPFNPVTEIEFNIPAAGWVTLEVFNMPGEKITTLLDQPMEAGRHRVTFRGDGLPAGLYFYTIRSGGFKKTQKCLLMK